MQSTGAIEDHSSGEHAVLKIEDASARHNRSRVVTAGSSHSLGHMRGLSVHMKKVRGRVYLALAHTHWGSRGISGSMDGTLARQFYFAAWLSY